MDRPPEPPTPDREPIDLLAEDYARRCRLGESPTVEEYASRHPELADEIRQVLPAVAFLERGKRSGSRSGSGTGTGTRSGLGSGFMAAAFAPSVKQLGENRIVRELGRGGMGIVYEAVQEPLGRRVAVKVLLRHAYSNVMSRQRFLREAKVVARLHHPHIVPIYAIGEQDGLPYYVMPMIDGAGLDRLPPDTTTEPREHARWVARLGRQAAEALAYAHGQGILHRDIKPANLLLDKDGTLWLADFGLAKLIDDLSITGTGDLPGTLRYLAPECLHHEADARSDVYSLGLTLYELLVGQPAFMELDRVRLLHQIEAQRVPEPRQLKPTIPRELETIVLKAMSADPVARYATAADLADDLSRFLEGHPIRARRATASQRLIHWSRRNPTIAALTATSIVLALIAAFFIRFYLMAPRFNPEDMRPPEDRFAPPPFRDNGPRPPFRPPPPARKRG